MENNHKIDSDLIVTSLSMATKIHRNPVELAENIVAAIQAGELNPLEVFTLLKRMTKLTDTVLENKEVKEQVLKEAQKHLPKGGKSIVNNVSFEVAPTYTSYDYKVCNHVEYNELLKIQTTIVARMKEIEKELVKIPKDGQVEVTILELPRLAYDNIGEECTVYSPYKHQTMGVKTSIF